MAPFATMAGEIDPRFLISTELFLPSVRAKLNPMMTDRLIEDKVYLSILANNLPKRTDVNDDVIHRTVSSTAGKGLVKSR